MATIEPSDFFLLRRPVLPINGFPLDDNGLLEYWSDDVVQEAIHTASPAFYEQIHQTIKKNGWPLPKALQQSLQRYLLRMSTRCTPFGLFAGCAVGESGDVTEVIFNANSPFIKYRRLDAVCLENIVYYLNGLPEIQAQLRFFPNDSKYTVGNELRYIESRSVGEDRHFFTSSVRQSEYVELVLELAKSGATIGMLTASLVSEGVSTEQATDFISELITQQLLVSDLGVAITESVPLTALLIRLSKLQGTQSVIATLKKVNFFFDSVEADNRSIQQEITQALEQYIGTSRLPHLTQTDLFLNTESNSISSKCLQTISHQLTQLLPLNKPNDNPLITDFVNQFRRRYDQQEIPLLQALDNESGIGYGSIRGSDMDYIPLLDKLTVPPSPQNHTVNWGDHEDLLLNKLSYSLRNRCLSVALTDTELQRIAPVVPTQLPANFYVLGNLLASSPAAIDEGLFSFNLLVAQGPSLANPLGRFCTHSAHLTEKVNACLRQEQLQKPDAVFAEIIHSPNERLRNVLTHPALYDYEIPVVSHCSVAADFQIRLDDLLVSVGNDNRIILRSRRMQKEVIPRLSTAHNYHNSLPVYQFLCDLQRQQGSLSLHWDWGALNKQVFLPRITYQNIIVSRARWLIKPKEIPCDSAIDLVTHLETQSMLPRWVAIAEGDNELVFNLNSDSQRQLFWEEVRKREDCTVVEWLLTPEQCWLQDKRGIYTNEVILTGFCDSQAPPNQYTPGFINSQDEIPPRFFLPGSEWLYVKIYAGTNTTNQLITEIIWPLIRKLIRENKISGWFFLRYADPEPHLRLRCQLSDRRFFGPLVNRLKKQLDVYRQAGMVHNVQIDTYERELERYGGATMLASEAIFAADSTATMQYFDLARPTDDHWLFALRTIDALLTDFDQDLPDRIKLMSELRDGLLDEFGADSIFKRQLNDKYRIRQRIIYQELTQDNPAEDSLRRILSLRSSVISVEATKIKAKINKHNQPSLKALLGSYIHMSMNRLFASQQRIQELVIYHHLARYYESRLARS